MASIIDQIKDRVDIVAVVERRVELHRAGVNLRGLCPFHQEKTPSFFVFPDSGRWKCFGCGESGDVFDFVQKADGLTLRETIRELAHQAGVELQPLTPEAQREIAKTREKETVFAAACEFFVSQMGKWHGDKNEYVDAPSTGLIYARDRGWNDTTIRAEGLGYFGETWDGLRAALSARHVDLLCPAAVALVGYRGDVAAWGQAHEVHVAQQWVEQGKVPAMPPQMLIYPHVLRGRVLYLAGRTIPGAVLDCDQAQVGQRDAGGPERERPKSWNPRREFVGDRLPFFNHVWGQRDARQAVIVEGQGCAVTLGQWGIAAVAIAGAS